MKRMMIIAAIALLGSLSAQAQGDAADKAWVAINTEKLNVQLDLTDDQEAKVKDIAERFAKKHEALEEHQPELSEKEMSDRTAALMMERDREMKVVLNAGQYAKWEEMRHKGTSDLTEPRKEKMEK